MNKIVAKQIKDSNNIAIFIHESPDGDCIGCAIAFSKALKNLGKNVKIFSSDKPKARYNFILPEIKRISSGRFDAKKYDLLITVDVPSLKNLGNYSSAFSNFDNTLTIDHHLTNIGFSKNNVIECLPSCGEVLYKFMLDQKYTITPEVATYLYMSIISDTACLQVLSATEETYKDLYELVKAGAEQYKIITGLFRSTTTEEIEKNKQLYDQIKYSGKNISYATFDFDVTDKFSDFEIGPMVEKIAKIQNIKFSFCLKHGDSPEKVRCSLRSVGNIDCSSIAKEFGGGGHRNAAGFETTGNIYVIESKILMLAKKIVK